jgi:hypothetical protein
MWQKYLLYCKVAYSVWNTLHNNSSVDIETDKKNVLNYIDPREDSQY